MKTRSYLTPMAFKNALEQRLKAKGGVLNRHRQLVVFERFLARIEQEMGSAIILKGGLALEMRLHTARSTKDIDLCAMGAPEDVLQRLQRAGRMALGDFMVFEVRADPKSPHMNNETMPYEGVRFRVECKLASKVYASPFGVDVAFGAPLMPATDVVASHDSLNFAGIAPAHVRLYPVELHLAEKLHAYTLPRDRPNTRIKDLPDIALLAGIGPLSSSICKTALDAVFGSRGSHPLPNSFPAPAENWEAAYVAMAQTHALQWSTLDQVYSCVATFLNPLLVPSAPGKWNHVDWRWESSH